MSSLLLLGNQKNFCFEAQPILSIVGWILTIFKIAIPLIIIIIGMFDLGKAAVIPSIVMLAFGFVGGFSKAQDQLGEANWKSCYSCIVRPWNRECRCDNPETGDTFCDSWQNQKKDV